MAAEILSRTEAAENGFIKVVTVYRDDGSAFPAPPPPPKRRFTDIEPPRGSVFAHGDKIVVTSWRYA